MYKCKKHVIITIGRTFGSGGREIGKKVAERLDIPYYDKELLEVAAKDGRLNLARLNLFDENNANLLFYSMTLNPHTGEGGESLDMVMHRLLSNAIRDVASQGPCVIVGRRADKILKDEYDTLNVFISASMEKRITRVSKRDSLPKEDSKKKIQKADKSRQSFYNAYGDGNWGEADNYDLCLNSGDLGIDHSAAMIVQYLKFKGKLL